MKKKISALAAYYRAHPKRFWVSGILIVIVLLVTLTHHSASPVTIVRVQAADLKQTVLATGQVTSQTDLDLSFSSSGVIARLPVSVGDKVSSGQLLAALDNRNEYASLKSAQANYQKVVAGSSNEEVAVAEASLKSAKSSLASANAVQDTLVASAHRALLNTDLTPALTAGSQGTAPTVSGTYGGDAEGSYVITPHLTGSTGYFTYTGVEEGTGTISTTTPKPLGTKGLYIQFASDYVTYLNDVWTVYLPNTSSSHYLADYNAYQNALKTHDSTIAAAQAQVDEAQANLDLKKAAARPADLAVAQAAVDAAQATYDKTLILAPASGTITHVDTKIGERADAQKEVVVLENVTDLYVEADINETSIAKVALGQSVSMTLDAFGPGVVFTGTVVHIDPSATTSDGVVNYKIKVSISDPTGLHQIRPGMNANMTITAWDHANVVAVPKAALITKGDGAYVNFVTDEKKGKYTPRKIETGQTGDGELVEVTSGLSSGDAIAVPTGS